MLRRSVLLGGLAVLCTLGVACQKSSGDTSTGAVRLIVRPLVADDSIARMVVTVSGEGFSPMVSELMRGDAQWGVRLPSVPTGPNRRFDVIALNGANQAIFSATAIADVEAVSTATVVSLTLDNRPPETYQNAFPVIDGVSWPEEVGPQAAVKLSVTAHDPSQAQGLHYRWSGDCGSFNDPTSISPIWTAPSSDGSCHLAIDVQNDRGASIGFGFTIAVGPVSGGVVTGIVNSAPVIQVFGGSLVVKGTILEGDLVLQAQDPDGDTLTYTWATTCAGATFTVTPPYGLGAPHLVLPLDSTPCTVTVSVFDGISPSGTTGVLFISKQPADLNCQNVVCPQGQACDYADGKCKPNGSVCTPSCSGKSCGSDGCGATCGTCGSGTSCSASGQCVSICVPACGTQMCGSDGCGGTCGTCGSGTSCNATGQCVPACTPSCSGKSCGSDGCGGTCGTCGSGASCNATGQCVASSGIAPLVARDIQLVDPGALAIDTAGAFYLTAAIYSLVPTNLQTQPGGPAIPIASTGDADIVLAKYDASGRIVWGIGIGDDDPTAATPQIPMGVAVTSDGRVAVNGRFTGSMTFGTSTLTAANDSDFLVALEAGSGGRLWGKSFNLGSNGQLVKVAANPNSPTDRIAVCGKATTAAIQLVGSGTTYGGNTDAVIGVFDSSGNRIWGEQLGNAGFETCNAVWVDDAGDVWAAGQFDGANLSFPATPNPLVVAGPNNANQKWIWVAKFAGAGNASGRAQTLAATAFTVASGQANPQALTTDPNGDLILGGTYTANLTVGGRSLTSSAGAEDAFFAKVSGASLGNAAWLVRFGGDHSETVAGVQTTSAGDIIAAGSFSASSAAFRTAHGGADTTGVAQLVSPGTVGTTDVYLFRLNRSTGAADFAAEYGSTGSQTGQALVVNRYGATPNQIDLAGGFSGTMSFGAAGSVSSVGTVDVFLFTAGLQ